MTRDLPLEEFWASIEDAWWAARTTSGELGDPRALLVPQRPKKEQYNDQDSAGAEDHTGDEPRAQAEPDYAALDILLPLVLRALETHLNCLDKDGLRVWDAHCAQLLFDIDREDVHAVLGGSDDGFLYTRGFVLAMGREYYTLVDADPRTHGIPDLECWSITYLGARVYRARFGAERDRGVCRESCSNAAGWPNL